MKRPMYSVVLVAMTAVLVATGCANPPAGSEADQAIKEVTSVLKTVSGGLNGTITVHESGSGTTSVNDGVIGKDQTTVTVNHAVTWNVIDGRAIAKVSYDHTTTKVSFLKYDQHSVTGTRKESIVAGGTSAPTNVGIDLRSDGTYVISFSTGGVPGTWTMKETSELKCDSGAQSCNSSTTENADSAPQVNQGGLGGTADGRVDKNTPNSFVGTSSSPIDFPDGGGKRTMTWNLSR